MNGERMFLDQDLLLSYVDGELPQERLAAVEAALIHDAEAWETVRLLRLSASAAAAAFRPLLDEPVPSRLVAAARGDMAAGPAQSTRKPWPAAGNWPARMAAGLALLALGLGAGYLLRNSADRELDGGYVPAAAPAVDPLAARFESVLLEALEKGTDGESFTYDSKDVGHGRIELGHRFATGFGADCREFLRDETRGDVKRRDSGLACRNAGTGWSVMIMTAGSTGG